MLYGLKKEAVSGIRSVFQHYAQVQMAILYGSRAMGTFRKNSDIDLTLQGKELTLQVLSQIETELDDLLLPFIIDLSLYRQIDNLSIQDHIRRVGIVFYAKE